MALSNIGLCARALVRLGAAPITSFDDDTAESEIAGILYDSVRDALLSAHPWSFATGQMNLTKLVTAPAADYAHAYQLPNDFLRAISLGSGGRGRGRRYRIARDQLHCNDDAVTLTYIFVPTRKSFPHGSMPPSSHVSPPNCASPSPKTPRAPKRSTSSPKVNSPAPARSTASRIPRTASNTST